MHCPAWGTAALPSLSFSSPLEKPAFWEDCSRLRHDLGVVCCFSAAWALLQGCRSGCIQGKQLDSEDPCSTLLADRYYPW